MTRTRDPGFHLRDSVEFLALQDYGDKKQQLQYFLEEVREIRHLWFREISRKLLQLCSRHLKLI